MVEPPYEQIRDTVRAGGLLPVDDRLPAQAILVMLSGGRDSTCLLDVAVALCGAERVHALHVNYGLRPEADGDEEHCRALCAQLAVELDVLRVKRTPTDVGNLQAWAREARYQEAMRIADRHDALVAVGHTASDQVETILYRLAASPGRRPLLGMNETEGRLIRPLLGLTREQTAAYCQARGLAWREDSSNQDERYARTRVRHGLLESLRAVHPAAEANVLRTAELLRDETQLLESLVTNELAGRGSIEIARLRELPAALARMVVVRLAEEATGSYVPQAGSRVGEILALGERGGSAELHIGGLTSAVIQDGELRMVRIQSREQHDGR
jgi:tRNA(Ile)-lysidine synthase